MFFLDDDTVQILGRCLEDGAGATILRLGTEGRLNLLSQSEQEVVADLPAGLPDGNYRITVKHGGGKAQWLAALEREEPPAPPSGSGLTAVISEDVPGVIEITTVFPTFTVIDQVTLPVGVWSFSAKVQAVLSTTPGATGVAGLTCRVARHAPSFRGYDNLTLRDGTTNAIGGAHFTGTATLQFVGDFTEITELSVECARSEAGDPVRVQVVSNNAVAYLISTPLYQ